MTRRQLNIVASSRQSGDGANRDRPAGIGAALAIAIAAFSAPLAKAADDWAAVVGGGADAQLAKRLENNVRTLPGTDTRYLIGGFIELDGLATRKQQTGDEQDTFLVSATPFGSADSDRRLSVRQSQVNWLSYTPTGLGTITARAEANLFSLDLDGTTRLSLQQLYVRIADALVVGKTYSTFVDADVLPTTLDYNGPSGETSVQQWQARVAIPLGAGWTIAGGLEDSQAEDHAGGRFAGLRTQAHRPDLAARLRFEFERGHVQVAALSRSIDVIATASSDTTERKIGASGVSISGSLATFGDDSLVAQYATGKGIGRYFNDSVSPTGVALGADDRLALVRSSGGTLYYQHHWTPDWMTVAGASTLWASDSGPREPDALRRVTYVSANIIHRLLPALLIGAETLWGRATRVDGVTATNARLQLSVRYLVR
jgi:hypothetical protein